MARGTKTEYKPGYWRLRVYVGDDPATGRPIQRSRNVRGGVRVADRLGLADASTTLRIYGASRHTVDVGRTGGTGVRS